MKQINKRNVENRLERLIRKFLPKTSRVSIETIKDRIYNDDTFEAKESVKVFQEWFLDIFDGTNADFDEVVALCMDSWNVFSHRSLGGMSPQEILKE